MDFFLFFSYAGEELKTSLILAALRSPPAPPGTPPPPRVSDCPQRAGAGSWRPRADPARAPARKSRAAPCAAPCGRNSRSHGSARRRPPPPASSPECPSPWLHG